MAKPKSILDCFHQALAKVISRNGMTPIAKEMADTVRIRAQLGGSVESTGKAKKPFKKLSPDYVEQRKKFKGLSNKTTPRKSNITRTGQLIESLRGEPKSNGFDIIAEGGRDDSDLTNSQVAKYVADQGRPFLDLSDKELKQLTRLIEESLADEIENCLNRSK